ncbi:hypothetical protein [Bacillus sp. EB600]|uniref:hypothetical protein n=1 Tax=Bacillus sp. EB600 TaxID=2806345 RepID=UPI00210BDBCF|nr:hypothetical protein [Bacillus sp. EB600]MCQ6281244.1 hypothetical protein [Bacillus sp. EB600]
MVRSWRDMENYLSRTGTKDGKSGNSNGSNQSSGLIGIELQGAMAIYTVSLKRILKLID